ncbi:hypothetical protein BCY86_02990 [Pajaroellobacter abortibovis]|uniref:Uncharacterized protein n=1 Tax=Pajaroellobacter abortibovis TaxID=1882918 RepID=A0A1L6MWF2_9BACT|nr:hypothetical protein BCY86_02990 [Pajaroellobacter abortibovis]
MKSCISFLIGLLTSCAAQGEGERCSTLTQPSDPDCAKGLICISFASLGHNTSNPTNGVCCPPLAEQTSSTPNICTMSRVLILDASRPPPDVDVSF